MDANLIQKMIFGVLGGLGIFLLGMKYMSEGLQKTAGSSLRRLIAAVTGNRFFATVVGILVTCLVQSSSVTTVMTVGFVNSGIMALESAIGVILGANIGTTITGWILVLKVGKWGLPILGVAAFVHLFSKREYIKNLALSVLGVGMVFYGLEVMKGGVKVIRKIPEFTEAFQLVNIDPSNISYLSVLAAAGVGCLLTVIVQSSSATLGITIALASQGVIGFETAAALVLGENIGTTITAMLASIGTGTNAKRAAYFHVIFNLLGTFVVTMLFAIYIPFIKWMIANFMGVPDVHAMVLKDGSENFPFVALGIATVHTVFNVMNVLIFLPFTHIFAKLLIRFVKDKKVKSNYYTHLDFQYFESPALAMEMVSNEIGKMVSSTEELFGKLDSVVKSNGKDEKAANYIFEKEDVLDRVQVEITEYISDLLGEGISQEDIDESKKNLRVTDELETISDDITQVVKLVLRLKDEEQVLSEAQLAELGDLHNQVNHFYNQVLSEAEDLTFEQTEKVGLLITQKVRDLREEHWSRLADKSMSPLVSTVYPDVLASYRRIKNHLLHVAEVKCNL
jgi:phosphate:Na+ symporter